MYKNDPFISKYQCLQAWTYISIYSFHRTPPQLLLTKVFTRRTRSSATSVGYVVNILMVIEFKLIYCSVSLNQLRFLFVFVFVIVWKTKDKHLMTGLRML